MRAPFASVLANLIATGSVPDGIGWIPGGAGGEWYLPERMPPQLTTAQTQSKQTCIHRQQVISRMGRLFLQ